MNNPYEEGRQARQNFLKSKGHGGVFRNISGKDAIKLFFPNVRESLMQVSTPLPTDRADWIKGWDDEMRNE